MATIVVTKTGQSLTTRESGRKNPRGEQMGTEDLVRRLKTIGHKVIYFGRLDGDLGVPVVEPDTSLIHTYMSRREQQERFDRDEANVRSALQSLGSANQHPPLVIEMCGMPAACSFVGNPRGVTPLMSSMRYTGPSLSLIRRLGSPRICVVCDVRSWPRDCEMSDGWPELRPAALLSNYDREWDMRVAFQDYRVRAVDCRSYSWAYLDWQEPTDNIQHYVCGVSHCHIGTGFRKKTRAEAWNTLLGSQGELFDNLRSCVMYGEGWHLWPGSRGQGDEVFRGVVDLYRCMAALDVSAVSPVAAPVNEFITNKAYLIASRGCLPALATDCNHAWDPEGKVVPLDHPVRCRSWTDTMQLALGAHNQRAQLIAELSGLMKQDFSVVENLVEDYDSGLYEHERQEWHRRYGGYEPA